MYSISTKFKIILDTYYQNHDIWSHDNYISNDLIKWLCKNSKELKEAIKKRMLKKLSDKEIGYLISTLENKQQFEAEIVKSILEKNYQL